MTRKPFSNAQQQKIVYCDSWMITEGKEVEGEFVYARSEIRNWTTKQMEFYGRSDESLIRVGLENLM